MADISTPTAKPRRTRATLLGKVTANKQAKTIRVQMTYRRPHGKYGKYMRSRTVVQAHDESGQAKIGDWVEVMECRPISKTKHWRLVRVVKPAVTV
ncbi:MAG: 30S ribosomal protein S17 [Phycisphaerae bacterium]|nr:30S ribosomal protein S17 [Phycisphaerae bacterium]